MLHVIYVIILEALVCGLMVNRTLCARWQKMWHLPIYTVIKAGACSVAVFLNGPEFITTLCIAISFLYALVCFSDRISRKLVVVAVGSLCVGLSNLFKFSFLERYGLTQQLKASDDVLASTICIAFSILIFTVLTIISTNIICRVRAKIVSIITGVMLLVLCFSAAVYSFMHSLVDIQLNSVLAIFALIFLLPAIVLLYFFEALIFSNRGNFFKA